MRILALLAAAVSFAAYAHDVTRPAEGVALDPKLGAKIPPVLAFVDDQGRTTTLARALGGRPDVVVLGSATCQDLCPVTLAGAARALRDGGLAPGRDYAALFVSIDPRDDPAGITRTKANDPPARAGTRHRISVPP